jgi:alpha-1,6-mannosyltransferase
MSRLYPQTSSSSAWSSQRSTTTLTMIGLSSLLIYVVYVVLFPLTQYGYAPRPFDMEQIAGGRHWMGVAWALGLVVLYGLFVVGLVSVDRSALSRRTVLVFSVLFGLTLIWLYPVTATDLFQYVLRARVWVVHGANPMTVAPAAFPDDPLLPFAGEWKGIVSPYGPAWELLAAGIASLGFTGAVSGALAYKAVACVAYLVCLAVLDWGTRRGAEPGANVRSLMLFAWNPLVLLQGVGNGHNDVVMLAWMLLAMVAWQRRLAGEWASWLIASAAVALAVLTKASAALMGLLLVVVVLRDQLGWRRRGTALVGMATVTAALTLLAYLPFWPPWQSIAGVLDEMSNRYTYTIAAMVRLWFQEFLPPRVAWDVPRATGQLLFLGVLIWSAVQLWRRRLDLASAGFLA